MYRRTIVFGIVDWKDTSLGGPDAERHVESAIFDALHTVDERVRLALGQSHDAEAPAMMANIQTLSEEDAAEMGDVPVPRGHTVVPSTSHVVVDKHITLAFRVVRVDK